MAVKKYTEEVRKFIVDNVEGTRTKDLADLVNKKFGFDITHSAIRAYMQKQGLKNNLPKNLPKGRPTELYPTQVRQFIAENYKGVGHKDMTDMLNVEFNKDYTLGQIKAYYAREKLDSGLTGCFKKGLTPWNKGMKGLQIGGKETQFKKGNRPHNWQPVGTERINAEGYIDIKIAEPSKWKSKHYIIWEESKGKVPKGYVLIFGDGNRQNVQLDNLILVSRAQLALLNKHGLIKNDAGLTKTGVLIADIYSKMAERKRKKG